MAKQQKSEKELVAERSEEQLTGTTTEEVERESTVNVAHEQRDDSTARERSTSPVPREGDTWESMDGSEERVRNGPQRRVGVLAYTDEGPETQVPVVDKVTRRHSHIRRDRFEPPYWKFIG